MSKLTNVELTNLKGTYTITINNYLKGLLLKTMVFPLNKGEIEIVTVKNNNHTLVAHADRMDMFTKRLVFNHSMLVDRFKQVM